MQWRDRNAWYAEAVENESASLSGRNETGRAAKGAKETSRGTAATDMTDASFRHSLR